MNGTKAYRAAYPGCKSDEVARAAAARLLANVSALAFYEEFEDADNPDQSARARYFRVASGKASDEREKTCH
jgi:hypothetical protein